MDLESAGAGMGGGIISAILVALGVNRRLEKLEGNVIYKDSCENCKQGNIVQFRAIHESNSRIESKLDTLLINLSRRREDGKH